MRPWVQIPLPRPFLKATYSKTFLFAVIAILAQLVEHQSGKLKVLGSSPKLLKVACLSVGGIAAIAAGCKPVTLETRRFESYPTDHRENKKAPLNKDLSLTDVKVNS